MKKSLLAIGLISITLGGCSLLRKQESATADHQDAMPMFPVSVVNETTLGGHWFVRTIGNIKVTGYDDTEWPYIEFVPQEARFYGTNGCNIINGSYRIGPAQTLALSEVATTMRLCPSDTLEYPMANALNTTHSFSVTVANDGSTILNLHNAKNLTVMTLRKSDIDFINGPWRVTEVNGQTVDNPDCKLIFDIAEGTLSGNTGCNIVRGDILREAKVSGSLSFSNLATTRMMCPDIQLEQSLLIALEEVSAVRRSDHGSIALLNRSGKTLVTLTPLTKADL